MTTIMVTGGAGLIGSNLVRHLLRLDAGRVINVDITHSRSTFNVRRYTFKVNHTPHSNR
jgi:nucleoside-diphosphate-sugar epimerase